ncbi:hypothetical protein VTK26DRAFT_8354 [Humicola hyalothermophila]
MEPDGTGGGRKLGGWSCQEGGNEKGWETEHSTRQHRRAVARSLSTSVSEPKRCRSTFDDSPEVATPHQLGGYFHTAALTSCCNATAAVVSRRHNSSVPFPGSSSRASDQSLGREQAGPVKSCLVICRRCLQRLIVSQADHHVDGTSTCMHPSMISDSNQNTTETNPLLRYYKQNSLKSCNAENNEKKHPEPQWRCYSRPNADQA